MDQKPYLLLVHLLDSSARRARDDLKGRLDAGRLLSIDTLTELNEVEILLDQIRLLRYIKAEDIPDSVGLKINKHLEEITKKEQENSNDNTICSIRDISEWLFEVIHQIGVVGKWPPDDAPR